jgi:hypothetical protein
MQQSSAMSPHLGNFRERQLIPYKPKLEWGAGQYAFNRAYRFVLSIVYPLLCNIERTFGGRSNVALVAVWHNTCLL